MDNGKPANFVNVCRIPKDGSLTGMTQCGYRIENPPLNIPIIGQPPEQRAIKICEAMDRHIAKVHPEKHLAKTIGVKIFDAWLASQAFNIEDPNAQALLYQYRGHIVQAIPRPFINDAAIQHVVAGLAGEHGLDSKGQQAFVRAMVELRNQLCELPTQPDRVAVAQ